MTLRFNCSSGEEFFGGAGVLALILAVSVSYSCRERTAVDDAQRPPPPVENQVENAAGSPSDESLLDPANDLAPEPVDDLVPKPRHRRENRAAAKNSAAPSTALQPSPAMGKDGKDSTGADRPVEPAETGVLFRALTPSAVETPHPEIRIKEPDLELMRPTGDMAMKDYGADCERSGCHGGLKKAPFVHGPVVIDECKACHKAKGQPVDHDFELLRPGSELCADCHQRPDEKHVIHAPFAEGTCLDCHDPHASNGRGLLLAETPEALCRSCHVVEDQSISHGPYALGGCLLCHSGHQSEYKNLLSRPPVQLCVQCHTRVEESLDSAAFVHGPAAVDCSACHFSHTADNRFFLREKPPQLCLNCHDLLTDKATEDTKIHGALYSEEGCIGCHSPHASQFKSLLVGVTMDLCLSCHDREMTNSDTHEKTANMKEVLAAKFRHGPIKDGDCQSCHFPHSSTHADLLHEAYPESFYHAFDSDDYALCFTCHEKSLVESERTTTLTNFRDGDRNLHFLHVNREKGRTCRACHEVHASESPFQIRDSVPFGTINWPLPINFKQTAQGGGCAPGCHKAMNYDNGGVRIPMKPRDVKPRESKPPAPGRNSRKRATEPEEIK